MPVVPAFPSASRRWLAGVAAVALLTLAIDQAVALPLAADAAGSADPLAEVSSGHLVVSELMTGGASASDEFIELYNPTAVILPLEGLEVVYVTSTGATVTRKAAWSTGAAGLPAGAHLLIANGAGVFAAIADVAYANGLAATGGSAALRIQGAATAIDAVGWGTAASPWLETRPAPAPAAASSLERLPGGASGSSQDTDDNLVDFAILPIPDPQNTSSSPIPVATATPAPSTTAVPSTTPQSTATPTAEGTVEPTAAATPTVAATPTATPSMTASDTPSPTLTAPPTPSPGPSPTPAPPATQMPVPPISIAEARAMADDSVVTIEGVALTASDFADGGGYLVDATAGISVLITDGSFSRGQLLRVTGTLDDRYSQRTIRSSATAISVLGTGSEPLPADAETGSIGEALEGGLVELTGVISSSATTLSTGLAWDLDDGSGATRVMVGTSTGIDTSAWSRGVGLTLVGVVGQRDSSGSGISGFRVQPRDSADVIAVEPIATASPTPTPEPTATTSFEPATTPEASATPTASASPTPAPSVPLVSIGEARAAATGIHLRIRGVVTAQSGLLEAGSAIVQDPTGAILVRLGTDTGSLALGELVELDGTRSTKAGMLTLRVAKPPMRLGTQADPDPLRRATGALGEADEARLVIARGVVSTAVSRPHGGSVSFAIDDGSGPIRVTIASRAGIASGSAKRGAWLELKGVLGQQTTGKAPLAGYRLWPRMASDLRVIAAPVTGGAAMTTCCAAVAAAGVHRVASGRLQDSVEGEVLPGGRGVAPIVTRPHPTGSPSAVTTATSPVTASPSDPRRVAGLVVSGMGLAALAALVAWFVRRRPGGDGLDVGQGPAAVEPKDAVTVSPHLALVRSEIEDAQGERRILPPT